MESATTISQTPEQSVQQTPQNESPSTFPMLIAVAVLIIVLLGGVGLFYLSYKSSQPKTVSTANQMTNQNSPIGKMPMNQSGASAQGAQPDSATVDPALTQDIQQIDQSLAALDNDVNNTNQSLNDQQGDLSSQ